MAIYKLSVDFQNYLFNHVYVIYISSALLLIFLLIQIRYICIAVKINNSKLVCVLQCDPKLQ